MATLPETQTKSAHSSTNSGSFIGDFKIDRLRIFTPQRERGSYIEFGEGVGAAWSELNFYEDITATVVHGDLTIQEGIGLVESVPLLGEEVLEVKASTAGVTPAPIGTGDSNIPPTPQEEENTIIHYFRIYKIDPPQKINDNFRQLKFHFVSDIMFTNMQIKVQKTYPLKKNVNEITEDYKPYTVADMAREIYVDCFIGDKKRPKTQLKTNIDFLVEPTSGVYSACIPNWNPFKALNFLAKRAISANQNSKGANFVFYQTLKGFRFVSIETLYQGGFQGYTKRKPDDSKFKHYKDNPNQADARRAKIAYIPDFNETYNSVFEGLGQQVYKAVYNYQPGNVDGISAYRKKFAVTEFDLISSFDTMRNLGMGMYANRVITHDLIRMKVEKYDFNYIKAQEEVEAFDYRNLSPIRTTTQNPEVDKQESAEIETKVDDFFHSDPGKLCSNNADMIGNPESYISLYPTNKDVMLKFATGIRASTYIDKDGEQKFGVDIPAKDVTGQESERTSEEYDKKVEQWLAQRTSQALQNETLKIHFSVPGDSAREVGDLIWFNYPSENPDAGDTGTVEPHKYYSGKYLITALRHKFTKDEYTMRIEAVKDGYRSQISPGFGLVNPRVQTPDGTGVVNG